MSEIYRYTLADRDGTEGDYEYDTLDEAKKGATNGQAVIRHVYEWSDSMLAWTPDGSDIWPPVEASDRP